VSLLFLVPPTKPKRLRILNARTRLVKKIIKNKSRKFNPNHMLKDNAYTELIFMLSSSINRSTGAWFLSRNRSIIKLKKQKEKVRRWS